MYTYLSEGKTVLYCYIGDIGILCFKENSVTIIANDNVDLHCLVYMYLYIIMYSIMSLLYEMVFIYKLCTYL